MTNKMLLEKWDQDLRMYVLPVVHDDGSRFILNNIIKSIEDEIESKTTKGGKC